MKTCNAFIKSALALAMAGAFGAASAATVSATPTDFALETCQPTTEFTLPAVTYTAGVAAIQDFYVTFTLSNGTFVGNPAAVVTNVAAGGTATLVAGGNGSSSVTFRMDGSSSAWVATDSVALSAGAIATGVSCSAPIVATAANGLLFIAGSVASPLEAVSAVDVDGIEEIATFTQAVTITMAETANDTIDLNPAAPALSRTVFGPTLDLAVASAGAGTNASAAETVTKLARQVQIAIGAQKEPDGATAFSPTSLASDSLVLTVTSSTDFSGITAICLDDVIDATCAAGESFNLTTGVATIAAGSWNDQGGLVLTKGVGTTFEPRTLTLNYALNVVGGGATRDGMTTHTYNYTAPTNNTWPIVYANGTLLRSAWFLTDANNTATMRLVNAGPTAASVVQATYHLDSGATGAMVGVDNLAATIADNTPINATSIPGLSTGTASRGYVEVVIAGDMANVDGQMISTAVNSGDRTVVPMRNVTFDTGVRSAAPF